MSQIGHLRIRKDKHGNDRFQMLVEVHKNHKKYFKSKTFSTKKEAEAWRDTVRQGIKNGSLTKENLKNRKLKHVIEKYVSEVLPKKPRNARNVEQHLEWWNKELGHLDLNDISQREIADGRDKLLREPTYRDKKRAPATVVRYICSLSCVFESAIKDWHWIEKNPVRMIRKPKVSNARTRFLSEEECKRLMAASKESRNPYLFPIVALALSTGMRRGEILSLRWEDIDFERKFIVLRQTKNGSMRYVPMISIAYQVLKSMYDSEPVINPNFDIFPSLNSERYLDIRTAWNFALKRANLVGTGLVFHSLRHSCGSFLAMSGANQRDIAEILGHKDLRMTQRYTHLNQEHLTDKMEKAIEKFIGSGA